MKRSRYSRIFIYRLSATNMLLLPLVINLLVFLDWFPSLVVATGKCPKPEEIMPCRCRGWNSQIQVWCSHSDLERVNGALEHLMKLRTMPAIDELIVENNRMPTLPARAFGALRIGRLLLRNNGLESISRNAFAGLEDFIEELYIVENKLTDFPFDSIENLKNLEAFTIEKSKIRLLPKFSGLNRLKHIRIDGSLISSLPIGAFSKMAVIKQIHLVNSNLGRIAEGIFGPLDSLLLLNFSGNSIDFIQRRSFALLPKLEVLSLANNKLEDPVAIGRACEVVTALKSLDVSSNNLQTLSEGSFVNLKSLQMLSLVSNQIATISSRSFTHLPALRKVDMSNNLLRNFPKHFFDTTPLLEELRLRRNLLSTPSEISQLLLSLKSIRYLDLGENGITSLQPKTFTNHTQLQRLDLSDNLISSIGYNAFVNVPTLMEMSLRNNSLSALIPTIDNGQLATWNIPSLIELDISFNKLNKLDSSSFEGLIQLTRIDLSFNNIKSLPEGSFTSNKNLEDLDLMGNGLSSLASNAFSSLRKLNKLDLSRNHLENLGHDLFFNMKYLQYLNLGNNRLNNLPAGIFSALAALEELNLRSNLLNSNILPVSLFSGLHNLKELNLRHNSLSNLDNNLFRGLKSLEILKLGTNQIAKLNDDLFIDNRKLKVIDFNNNRAKELAARPLSRLPELEKFEARENRIHRIDTNVFQESKKSLQVLDLAHNSLSTLPEFIKDMVSLKVLDLSHNQISSVGSEDTFRQLQSLMELYINDNSIQELPQRSFSNLESLTIADLDGNDLSELKADTFTNLPRLIYLRISRNKLKSISNKAFSNLHGLDGLDLQENELESIGELAFDQTGSLKYLNLSHNNFDSMSRMGLFPLTSIEVLDMSYNRISAVDEKSLRHLKWLVELRISDNGICRLPVGVFDGMSRLKMLIVKNNFLSRIYETVFYKLKNNIAFIDISGNPISCDCELSWLRDLMSKDSIQELTDSTCETPNDLKGVPIKTVRASRMTCSNDNNNNVLRRLSRGRGRAFADEELCPILANSKRKPRPLLSQSRQPAERPLFGSSPSSSSSEDSDEYASATTNDLKNRRKDEKLLESNDYLPGDTPTIYAGSTTTLSSTSKHKGAPQSGIKSTGNALSNLGSLLGISLPELDFGLNLGISPSVSINEKNKFGTGNRADEDDDEDSSSFTTNAILSKPNSLPSSWLSRPSKIDENLDEDDDVSDTDDDDTIPNIYEPPEYIPRRPAQPYIPLNPFAESNNRANVVNPQKKKNNSRGPLGSKKYDGDNNRPIRFPSSNASPEKSWLPTYPNTETGFIPIEPFFHSHTIKSNTNPRTGSISSPGIGTTAIDSTANLNPSKVETIQGMQGSSSTTIRPTNEEVVTEPSTSKPFLLNGALNTPSKPPPPAEYIDDHPKFTQVEVKHPNKKPNEDEDGLPDFWSMFTSDNDDEKSKDEPEGNPKSQNPDIKVPFNFSAPIDTVGFLESSSMNPVSTFDSNNNVEQSIGSASNPIPNDGSSKHQTTSLFSSTNFTSTITTTTGGGGAGGRKPTGLATVTRVSQTGRVGDKYDQSFSSSSGNPESNDRSVVNNGSIRRSLGPPVIIGPGEEPLDWYYTGYDTNQQQAGEELEKYLERSRVNQVDDVLIDISHPTLRKQSSSASPSKSSANSLIFKNFRRKSSHCFTKYIFLFMNVVLCSFTFTYSYQILFR